MSSEHIDSKAEHRRQVILAVKAERLTATEGARELGVSRKTYYEWEARAMAAMDEALRDRPGGRPTLPVDLEKEALRQELADLEKDQQVLTGRLRIQEAVREVLNGLPEEPRSKKKL